MSSSWNLFGCGMSLARAFGCSFGNEMSGHLLVVMTCQNLMCYTFLKFSLSEFLSPEFPFSIDLQMFRVTILTWTCLGLSIYLCSLLNCRWKIFLSYFLHTCSFDCTDSAQDYRSWELDFDGRGRSWLMMGWYFAVRAFKIWESIKMANKALSCL